MYSLDLFVWLIDLHWKEISAQPIEQQKISSIAIRLSIISNVSLFLQNHINLCIIGAGVC